MNAASGSSNPRFSAATRSASGGTGFYNPFASPRARAPVAPAAVQRTAPLQLVSSRRVVATPNAAEAVEEGRLLKVGGGGSVWVASSAAQPEPVRASTPPKPPSGPEPSNDYWAQPAPTAATSLSSTPTEPKTGGGGRGGSGMGGGGDGRGGAGGDKAMKARTGYEERIFDQDDFTGLLIAIALLLLLGWMWLQGRGGLVDEEASVQPQMAANEPAPAEADPFGPGPVDLRPTSPVPEPSADIVIEPAELGEEGGPSPSAQPVPDAKTPATTLAENPATDLTRAVVPAPDMRQPVQAYFCTASSSLTPAGRVQFDRQVAAWKSSGAELEFVVTGYADTRGTTSFNAQLGALRADYVADLLRAEGFAVTEAIGVGEIDGIEDEANCPNQRRVDIALKGMALSTPTRACLPPPDVQPLACA